MSIRNIPLRAPEDTGNGGGASAPTAPAAPAGIGGHVAQLLEQHAPHLSEPQKQMVISLAQSQKWAGDVTTQLNGALEAFGPPITYRGRGGAAAAPARAFDPGVPSGTSASKIPLDPLGLPQSVVDAMTPAQAKEWYDAYIASSGKPQHPFKAARDQEKLSRSGELASEISRAIADQLGKLR